MADIERDGKPTVESVDNVEHKKLPEHGQSVGYEQYREALDLEISDKEMRKVRMKIDLIIVPIFLVTQGLQFLDKTALNYANLFNYQDALGLKGQEFNYLSAIVYAGYFIGQYPLGNIIGRYPAQKVLATCILVWGVLVILLTQARSFSSASAFDHRFTHIEIVLMGLFEASVTPNSSPPMYLVIGSYVSTGIAKLPEDTTPERWKIIFYIVCMNESFSGPMLTCFQLGGVTILWSAVVWFVLADSPSNASFLSHREKLIAVKRVAGNETGIKNKKFDMKQVWLGFTDIKAILLFISVFAAAIPNGVVNSFSTIIIKDLGFSTEKTTELKSVGDAVNVVALIIGGIVILNVPDSRLITATIANLLCTVSAATLGFLPRSNTWGRLVSFWLVNSQSVGFTVSLTTISSNMAGYTHRSFASALVFTAYCWGNFAGPFVVKQSEAPTYTSATIGLLVGYGIKSVCHLILLVYMFSVNRHRNSTYGLQNKAASDEAGMNDLTEFQNKDFRYVL
ncbi:hypothetical protein FHL15_008578 [Xylaria flabelliformis]|uniref:Uncharacterized protein n=1 Tax=Xylaria flabelliformis TaxID=2512241 RepID=A0A553HRL4_9PEZI|nr:hypothetical protein FHL15_008578 [Xylaria flabelliformis]